MKKIKGRLFFLFIIVGMPIIPALAQAGTTVIEIQTEGSGDILEINNSLVNLNGAMVWDGSKWVVNSTWAHKFFVDTRTGERLKQYNSQVYQGTSPTGLIDPFGNYTITRNLYTYREPAKAGNLILRL